MSDISAFLARNEVWFEWAAMVATGALVYADRLPVWAVLVIVALSQTFSFIGMKNGKRDGK